jgi:hypothetical protein
MKLRSVFSYLALAATAVGANAGLTIDINKDRESIKAMTGCYEIVFQSAETFAYDRDYEHYPRYRSGALEWIFVDEEDDKKINLQHLLVIHGTNHIVKHWRQQWEYEATHALDYRGFSNWNHSKVEDTKGTWVQRVYQVDDSPRYECSAPWIHTSKKSYWECEANAPLPRREFSVRDDYNVLVRGNRHELTPYGHVHDQNNVKVVMNEEGVQTKLAMEKSYNTYKKVEDSRCQPAIDWWKQRNGFWHDTQDVWEEVLYSKPSIKLDFNKYGSKLWMKLFQLDDKLHANGPYNSDTGRAQIKSIITGHIVD